MLTDVKKAHLNGEVPEDEKVFVLLPSEAGGGVARLKRWLYGVRPAAKAWEKHCATRLTNESGFRRGISAATVFWRPRWDVSLVVHGDDFTALGPERHLREFEKQMRTWYTIKMRGLLGPEPHDGKEITVLNRKLVWRDGLITYEADPRIEGNIWEAMGLEEGSKTLDTPIVVEDTRAEEDEELSHDQASKFRSVGALANYLPLDRPDLQVAVSVLCQKVARLTAGSWLQLKRVARYLKKYPVLLYEFWEDGEDFELKVFSDSDWAGDRDTRRSRSGGVALLAGCTVKSWSNRQATPAMSSAEAEYYALVKASAGALGIQALAAEDLGWGVCIRLCVDSSAAKAMASRSGVLRVRHMEVRFLWLQDVVMRKRLELKKICGKKNPADVLTKPLSHSVVRELLSACMLCFEDRPGTDVRGEGGVGDSNPSLLPADSVQRRGVRPLLARAVRSAQSTGDDRK